MGALFVYILKSSVCLALLYLCYRSMLSRETFHRFNRLALLGVWLLSLGIPLIKHTTDEPLIVQEQVIELEELFILQSASLSSSEATVFQSYTPEISWTWRETILTIYLLGLLFFLSRNIYSLVRTAFLLRRSRLHRVGKGFKLVIHSHNFAPFSWMGFIVVSDADLKEGGREILVHEREHIRRYHFLDLMLAELLIFFQWFNPVAWLFKKELQSIHEYEADEAVLRHGINAKQYQLLLIKKAVGTVRFNSLANNFNHSTLKKRIAMMLKKKSNPWKRLKYLYVFPLVAVTVVAFARPEVSDELDRISLLEMTDLVSTMEESVDKTRLNEEVNPPSLSEETVPTGLPETPSLANDTIILRDTVYVTVKDTVMLAVKQKEISERVQSLKDFLDTNPYAWIVVNRKEMAPYNFCPEDYEDSKYGYEMFYYDESKRFGKRAEGGVLLINTPMEYFKNVIVKNHGYEAARKVLRKKESVLILDGEEVPRFILEDIGGSLITGVKIEDKTVYMKTQTGHMVNSFIKKHPNALILYYGKEIDLKELRRMHYTRAKVISTSQKDESERYGPKAKNGLLLIGSIPEGYPELNRQ